MATNENISPQAVATLSRELTQLVSKPLEGIRVYMNEENIVDIQADIDGPASTPYHGGVFRMKLILPQDFPQSAPKGYFLTKIFHPNVSPKGEICVNVLKRDWKATLGLKHVLQVIRCLLIEPFPESALNEEAGKLLLEDYEGYAKHARLMTSIHATKKGDKAGEAESDENPGDLNSGSPKKVVKRKDSAATKKRSLKRL